MPVTFTQHMAWHMFARGGGGRRSSRTMIRGTRLDPVRPAPGLFSPLIACLIEFVVVWGWHLPVPASSGTTRRPRGSPPSNCPSPRRRCVFGPRSSAATLASDRLAPAAGVIALVLTFAHMTMLGVLIAMAPRELYGHAAGGLADQQHGGAVMVACRSAWSIRPAALWLSRSLVAPRAAGGAAVNRASYLLVGWAGLLLVALVVL